MKKIYLLIDYAEYGSVLQVKSFHNFQNAIEEGKQSLKYDYDRYFQKHYQEYFHEMPSLEELINQWEKQNYCFHGYLEIMESEIYD